MNLGKKLLAATLVIQLGVTSVFLGYATAAPVSNIVNVKTYGALGNGTKDDTAAVQKAIDAGKVIKGGAKIYFPKGKYVLKDLKAYSNMTLYGDGNTSILKQMKDAASVLTIEGTSTTVASNQSNITISNLAFEGRSVEDGFKEHNHLLILRGVSNVNVKSTTFTAPQGDAIYLASHDDHNKERHNVNVNILNNTFDGVNKENRNGISVIDGTSITIQKNLFKNLTRKDMPGPIDVEPNGFSFSRVNNITIDSNRFENNGGGVGVISFHMYDSNLYTTKPGNFKVTNNIISETNATKLGVYMRLYGQKTPYRLSSSSSDVGVLIENNTIKLTSGRNMQIRGVKGLTVKNNTFSTGLKIELGKPNDAAGNENCLNVNVLNNKFLAKSTFETVFDYRNAQNITFTSNLFTK